jgi:hypothetical protein
MEEHMGWVSPLYVLFLDGFNSNIPKRAATTENVCRSVPSTCKIFFIVSVGHTCRKSPAVSYWPVFQSLLFSPLPLA